MGHINIYTEGIVKVEMSLNLLLNLIKEKRVSIKNGILYDINSNSDMIMNDFRNDSTISDDELKEIEKFIKEKEQ